MNWLVSGNDARFLYLTQILNESGHKAVYGQLDDMDGAEGIITSHSINEIARNGALEGKTVVLFGGASVPEGCRAFRVLDDPIFANENAVLTAEGAVWAAMSRVPFAICRARAMVIGYGRIGRALTEYLIGLRAVVTVVSRREQARLQAFARGANAASPEQLCAELPDQKLVFVTSPERMLGETELWHVSTSAHVFDLSGAPYGVDVDCARAMQLNVTREPGIPGRYCPESAARAIADAVRRHLAAGGME